MTHNGTFVLESGATTIVEFGKKEELKAFRSNGNMILEASVESGSYYVEIMDMTGRKVVSDNVEFSEGRGQIAVPGYGPYIVRMPGAGEPLIVKTFYYLKETRVMKRTVFISAFFLMAIAASAQPNNPSTPAPLDGGVSLLIAAGAGLGAKKLYDKRKAK